MPDCGLANVDRGPAAVVCLLKSPALLNAFALSTLTAPPIGIAYLAGTLRDAGIAYQVVDAVGEAIDQIVPLDFCDAYAIGLTMDEIVARIDERADIIGLSCMFSSSWPYDRRLVDKIRERFPKATIVLGGEHATACARYILETCNSVDICVRGEGEETFLALVRTLRDRGDLDALPGLAFRRDGQPHFTEARKRIRDIDGIPVPAWDQVPIDKYMAKGLGHGSSTLRSMPLMATRGCPYQCTFCSSPQMWTTRWMARTPSMVVDEMQAYIERYGAQNFDLYDLTAIIKKNWIMDFASEILRRGMKIEYQLPSGTRSEAIDEEVAEILYRSGCRQMNYAPETGSAATLERIKKKVKLPRLEQSLRGACRNRLKVMVNIILFPDDTGRDVWETFKFMLRCSWAGLHDITFVPYVPYPGAELYDRLVREGRLPGLGEEYFISLLTHSDITTAKSHNPRFSARQVQWLRLAFLSLFYSSSYLFRPYRVFTNLRNVIRNTPTTRGERTLRLLIERVMRIRRGRVAQADPA
ncbi:B12-binding domain-containing radical SAM protein [Reyranella sp.]|uniref:B12-binding domain-containing radical SAM protein n=1 Tax=Reyranella sp. TaxID=1929291 RepID=UPI003D131647